MAPLGPATRAIRGLGTGGWLLAHAARGIARDLIDQDRFARRRLAAAVTTYLWRPLPVLAALAALAGLIAGIGATRLLGLYHAEMLVEPPLVHELFRELVPLVVGIFASGRVSVELASRLAGTALSREIEALESLGLDPVRHLLSPALAAVVLAVPVHMSIAALFAWGGAGLVLDLAHQTDLATFFHLTAGDATARALAAGTLKALAFGVIAVGVGGAVGSAGARSAAQIGGRATTAFTVGLLMIVATAVLWTALE